MKSRIIAHFIVVLLTLFFIPRAIAGQQSGKSISNEAGDLLSNYVFKSLLRCGDSDYEVWEGPHLNIIEVKNLRIRVVPEYLTEADKANGVEWRGHVRFYCKMHRMYEGRGSTGNWGQWYMCGDNPWEMLSLRTEVSTVTKAQGKWYGWSLYERDRYPFPAPKISNWTCDRIPK